MSARTRRALGVWLIVASIVLAVTAGAPLPGGALIAIGALSVSGIVTIARTGVL